MRLLSFACALALTTPLLAAEAVNVDTFIRAETDMYMQKRVALGCFGKLCSERKPMAVDAQEVIRLNRDTPYSAGVFDLTSPVTITMPDPGKRFQSIIVINEDHYIKHVSYTPGPITLTRDTVGTRYAYVVVRTFMDPNSPADQKIGWALQDAIKVSQANPGTFEIPEWDNGQRDKMRTALLGVAPFLTSFDGAFGDVSEVDPVKRLIGAAAGWGGNNSKDAMYLNRVVPDTSGAKPYTLTVGQVPVDGFWSITVYNAKGFYEAPETTISVNNITAKPNKDGTVTVHFGGDPKAPNYLRIMPGWNYTVRLYRPRAEVQNGSWKFPNPVEAK